MHNGCGGNIDSPIDGTTKKQYAKLSPRKLNSNIWYKTGKYDYRYHTNVNGFVDEVSVKNLQLDPSIRPSHYKNPPDKAFGDDAGHLIADRFGGSRDLDNIVAQSSLLNRSGGDWYAMEKRWADVLDNGGTITDLKINLSYSGTSGRPTSFTVSYKINGKSQLPQTFKN